MAIIIAVLRQRINNLCVRGGRKQIHVFTYNYIFGRGGRSTPGYYQGLFLSLCSGNNINAA